MNEPGSKTMEYGDYEDSIQEIIAGKYSETRLEKKRSARIAQRQSYIDIYKNRLATLDLSNNIRRENRIKRRISRQEKLITKIVTWMETSRSVQANLLESNECIGCVDNGGPNGSVPEPSTIALLGMGLVGIGVARRIRKKT